MRMSSTHPNLQQIPSGKEWRSLFIKTNNTKKLVATDFDTQEIKILAEVTGVKSMQDFFIKEHPIFKDDFHSFSATNMFRIVRNDPTLIINKKDHAHERTISKSLTFKSSYGGSGFTIAQDLGISIEEGDNYLQGFFDGFPGLKQNFEVTKKLALKRGWIELDSYTKKRYFFPHFKKMQELSDKAWTYYPENYRQLPNEEKIKIKTELKNNHPELSAIWKEYMILKGKLERCGLNYRIQANASIMTKIAVLLIDENNQLDEGVLLIVHDEVVEEYNEEKCEVKAKFTCEKFTEAGKFTCKSVPMSGTAAIGDYWIH